MANGKGDRRRKRDCSQEEWDRRFDAIFGGYPEHVKKRRKQNDKLAAESKKKKEK